MALKLESRDLTGTTWTSTTRLRTDRSGRATAGAGAIYRLAAPKHPNAFYIWSDTGPMTFRATASQGGRAVASTTFTRELGPITVAQETLGRDGFVGRYLAPRGARRRPALLVLGGSEGGLATGFLGASLAGSGYPTLAVAYFREHGLPSSLRRVPLEYFARALRWLAAQPQVDPKRIVVLGISRGSEAAQLLGIHYPKLVHGVVPVVPSDLVNCSFPGCADAAWTYHGRPLPYAEAAGASVARIPDEQIRGPILFICAGQDQIWGSCDYARDAMRHLARDEYPHALVVEPLSDHFVGSLVPYEPNPESAITATDEAGREDAWPRLLAFLAAR